MADIDLTLVIAFHNEEKSLEALLPRLIAAATDLPKSTEIILVDDSSTDNSYHVAKQFQQNFNPYVVYRLPKRAGQTGAYRLAFEKANGDFIIRLDADLQDDPHDLPKFVEKINEGAELIMGLRECRKHSKLLRIASALYDILIVMLFNSPLHSNSGSYVCFKAELVKNITWKKNDHRYLPLIAMKRGAKNISEVFVKHGDRLHGTSKYQPMRKVIFGIPEVFLFLYRYWRNYYG